MENIYKNSKALLQKLSLLVEKKEENFENIKFELEKTIEKLHFANRALFALSATCEAIVGDRKSVV